MEPYSSEASYIIRQDFLRFSSERRTSKVKKEEKAPSEKLIETALEATRKAMAHDDGMGSLGRYKCPIF
jgi:hypothetical protein